MNRLYIFIFIVLAFHTTAQTPETGLTELQRAFGFARPDDKYALLREASAGDIEWMGPLFHDAVTYVVDNGDLLETIPVLRKIALLAVRCIDTIQYKPAKYTLWKLFLIDETRQMRVIILDTISDIAKRDVQLVRNMADWLDRRNNETLAGKKPDLHVIKAMLEVLGNMGDPAAFGALLRTMNAGYIAPVAKTAERAFFMIRGDTTQMYLDFILEGSFPEKKAALLISRKDENLSVPAQCKIAEFSLDVALHSVQKDADDASIASGIRRIAVEVLGKARWSSATGLVIEHFNNLVASSNGRTPMESDLIDTIRALGNMKTHEAAKRLTLYLEFINSLTESGKPYDLQIVLALIAGLANLGDKVAASALLAVGHMDYSLTIKNAAKDAMKKLD